VVGRERRRLVRAFRVAMAAALGPAVMMACNGSNGGEGSGAADAAVDGTLTPDAGPPIGDAGPRDASDASKSRDAGFPDAFAQGGCALGSVDLGSAVGVDGAPDGQDTCAIYYGCGLPEGLGSAGCNVLLTESDGAFVVDDGALVTTISGSQCWLAEDAGCIDDAYAPGDGGAITILCFPCFGGGGRRPAGLLGTRSPSRASGTGAYLAELAYEEEASITAFERMRAELVCLAAPRALVAGAARAARDEVRHARTMTRLAERRGGRVAGARVRRGRKRATWAIAAENAAEGCVKETYGALLARWQAAHAADGELRHAFTRIARDEARHAALSWALARWIEPKLDASQRTRVERARARALRTLAEGVDEPEASVVRDAGLPTASQARALLSAMARELGLTKGARR